MKKQDYQHNFIVDATTSEAFKCINQVTKWWTENVEGNTQQLHDKFTVRFGTTWKVFSITEVIPNQKVVWEVMDSYLPWNKNKTEWTGTTICFDLVEKDKQTEVQFIHVGLTPQFNCFDACKNAWTDYLENSLKNLINTGKGQPDQKK